MDKYVVIFCRWNWRRNGKRRNSGGDHGQSSERDWIPSVDLRMYRMTLFPRRGGPHSVNTTLQTVETFAYSAKEAPRVIFWGCWIVRVASIVFLLRRFYMVILLFRPTEVYQGPVRQINATSPALLEVDEMTRGRRDRLAKLELPQSFLVDDGRLICRTWLMAGPIHYRRQNVRRRRATPCF